MKILVTGGAGYIGSVACDLLLENNHQLVVLDNLSRGYKDPIELLQKKYGEENLRFYEKSLSDDLTEIFTENKDIEAVVHYAAFCLVSESMDKPQKYFTNNTCGTQNLLSTMIEHGVKKLVFSSTCAVYGECEPKPITEDHSTVPTNPYGESKRMSEKIIEWYGKLGMLNYVILRYFNICGATEDGEIGDSKKPSQLLMQNAVRGALNIEPFSLTCPEVDTPDKTPVRDYINVVDLNEAHLKALKYLTKGGKSETINLGTGTGNSVLEIVNKVMEITGAKFEVNTGVARKGEYAVAIADVKKAKKILGWEPTHTIEDSVKALVKWYTAHPKGWED